MRQVKDPQLQFGETPIDQIRFDPRSRDDIPQLLRGLQYIYLTPDIRAEVFRILEEMAAKQADTRNGRPGMELWKVLVMGTLRLNLNWDYDRLLDQVNHHQLIREMLGHGLLDDGEKYKLQTLKDNVGLLTVETLDRINQAVVKAGHVVLKKNGAEGLDCRCDSFVVETDVHYPTDINLLWDAMRKVVELTAAAAADAGLPGWRKSKHLLRKLKRMFRRAQQAKRSTSSDPGKKAKQDEVIRAAHEAYLRMARDLYERAMETVVLLQSLEMEEGLEEISRFAAHAQRQMDQVGRRVLKGEVIPHGEKVFSVFEEHTEWISKGKAGVPVELGLRVCVVEDRYRFILHHRVMRKETDDQVAVPMVEEARARFPELRSCSFDKGFHSPGNQAALKEMLERVVLPRKGKLSREAREAESEKGFVRARRRHSAVESAINALEVHGLDRCPDHGIERFEKYVALAVLARNVQRLGAVLIERDRQRAKRLDGRRKIA